MVGTNALRKGTPNNVKWESEHQEAFLKLKDCITSAPILKTPDFTRPFLLQTDASDYAVGAALLQEFDDGLHPVAFASEKLQPRETRYSVIERECVAIICGIQKFDMYQYGKEFILCTDHSALQYIHKKKPENSRLLRWFLFLQNYRFKMRAIKGTENVLSDFLSRM